MLRIMRMTRAKSPTISLQSIHPLYRWQANAQPLAAATVPLSGSSSCWGRPTPESKRTRVADCSPRPLRSVRRWTAIRTTRKHYLQARAEQVDAARRALDEVMTDVSVSE
jgi:hypothetical protein